MPESFVSAGSTSWHPSSSSSGVLILWVVAIIVWCRLQGVGLSLLDKNGSSVLQVTSSKKLYQGLINRKFFIEIIIHFALLLNDWLTLTCELEEPSLNPASLLGPCPGAVLHLHPVSWSWGWLSSSSGVVCCWYVSVFMMRVVHQCCK